MILFPNAKINLGLQIHARRPDGYHDLQTIFYPIAVNDVLEIVERQRPTGTDVSCTVTGIPVAGDVNDNLCVKAYRLLARDLTLPPVDIHLHKHIPLGAGLGGGSSDGAHALLLLNRKFELKRSPEQLIRYALQLGSDCPFFIINRPCIAEGRGEHLQPIELDLSGYSLSVINPGIHVSTAWAFSQLDASRFGRPRPDLTAIIRHSPQEWRNALENDFEEVVFSKYDEIKAIRDRMYREGALYTALSGSGSTVYGIFPKGQRASAIDGYTNFFFP